MKSGFDGKVRLHTSELPNQKHAAKAYISDKTFYTSGFVVDELCYIESNGKKHEAVAVLGDRTVRQDVVQLSRALKEAAGLDLEGPPIHVQPGSEAPREAELVVVREVTSQKTTLTAEPIDEQSRPHWEWLLKGHLGTSPN